MKLAKEIGCFIVEMKLRGKSELQTCKAKDLQIGDSIKVMNVVNNVVHIDSDCVYYGTSKKHRRVCNRIGLRSQERIEKL